MAVVSSGPFARNRRRRRIEEETRRQATLLARRKAHRSDGGQGSILEREEAEDFQTAVSTRQEAHWSDGGGDFLPRRFLGLFSRPFEDRFRESERGNGERRPMDFTWRPWSAGPAATSTVVTAARAWEARASF
ncbi:hypothetical protein V6N11_021912 [Hibiscus sabdariffa]|uniref:Uncharacterized protein n=1 Tax=Hibiscus sabdariffa TaxID=183260 RepID=A0ABR2THV4_9ROSI